MVSVTAFQCVSIHRFLSMKSLNNLAFWSLWHIVAFHRATTELIDAVALVLP